MDSPKDMNEVLKGAFGKDRGPLFTLPQRAPKQVKQESRYLQDMDSGISAQKVFDPNFGSPQIKNPPSQYDDEGTAPAMSTQGPWGQPPAEK